MKQMQAFEIFNQLSIPHMHAGDYLPKDTTGWVASDAATHACSSSSRQQQHCGTVASVGLLGLMGPKAWATGEAYSIAFATIGGMSAGMLASAEHFIEIR
eukprot:scaffold66294_cov15-Tisochrysis_lutea.AAC.2